MDPRTDPTTIDHAYCRVHGYHGFSVCAKCRAARERFLECLRRMRSSRV